MMSNTLEEVTGLVHKAIRELQAASPDSGFIVIGMSPDGLMTGLSMASNIDEHSLKETLVAIVEDKGEDVFPILTPRMVN
jgi:hypothetical protein